MKPALLAALLTTLCSAFVSASALAALPEPVARSAREAGLPQEAVALWVAPAEGGAPSLAHRGDAAMNPASVMKLLVSVAALDQLGPAYTWRTRAWLDGRLEAGVLDGAVRLDARGDPALTWDRLGQWLRDWRARGLREIRGDISVDTRSIAAEAQDAFDTAPHRAYHVTPEALLVNFGTLTLRLAPEAARIQVTALTPAAPLRVENRLRLVTGACTDWRNRLRPRFVPEAQGYALTLEGDFPQSCGERELNLKVDDPLRWAEMVLRAQWTELGGRWDGRLVSAPLPAALAAQAPFSVWQSPALPEVLRDMNKWSNNVMARQLLLTLGDDGSATPLTRARGIARVQDWMRTAGLTPEAWVLENGSGLSRVERTTASQLGRLLQFGWSSPRMPELAMALPVIGRDGTMRSRLTESPLAGRGYIKTGTLDGVKAAAGYVLDARGHWQAVVLLLNHPKAAAAEAVVDSTLDWVWRSGN